MITSRHDFWMKELNQCTDRNKGQWNCGDTSLWSHLYDYHVMSSWYFLSRKLCGDVWELIDRFAWSFCTTCVRWTFSSCNILTFSHPSIAEKLYLNFNAFLSQKTSSKCPEAQKKRNSFSYTKKRHKTTLIKTTQHNSQFLKEKRRLTKSEDFRSLGLVVKQA